MCGLGQATTLSKATVLQTVGDQDKKDKSYSSITVVLQHWSVL